MGYLKCIGCHTQFGETFNIYARGMCSKCYNKEYYKDRTNFTTKEVSTECPDCHVVFNDDNKRYALGRCRSCYQKHFYSGRSNKKLKPTNCKICDIAPGQTNEKGKLIEKLIAGYCKRCYTRRYIAESCPECKSCGVKFAKVKLSCLCDNCEVKKTKRKANSNWTPSRWSLSPQDFQDMMTLFRRYKNGTQSRVDAYRVVDLFLTVYEGHPFVYNSSVDSYKEDSQIVIMLRMLKSVYDNV